MFADRRSAFPSGAFPEKAPENRWESYAIFRVTPNHEREQKQEKQEQEQGARSAYGEEALAR
jgi:hypothetical protein